MVTRTLRAGFVGAGVLAALVILVVAGSGHC